MVLCQVASSGNRKKLAQASARISKLEGHVEIQRQRLGQYYQRFYPSSLAVAAQRLMALGAALNYKLLLGDHSRTGANCCAS